MGQRPNLTENNQHLVDLLVKYYLDKHKTLLYTRWDAWLSSRGYITECVLLMLKTDDQLNNILQIAKTEADGIINSKLSKALK